MLFYIPSSHVTSCHVVHYSIAAWRVRHRQRHRHRQTRRQTHGQRGQDRASNAPCIDKQRQHDPTCPAWTQPPSPSQNSHLGQERSRHVSDLGPKRRGVHGSGLVVHRVRCFHQRAQRGHGVLRVAVSPDELGVWEDLTDLEAKERRGYTRRQRELERVRKSRCPPLHSTTPHHVQHTPHSTLNRTVTHPPAAGRTGARGTSASICEPLGAPRSGRTASAGSACSSGMPRRHPRPTGSGCSCRRSGNTAPAGAARRISPTDTPQADRILV